MSDMTGRFVELNKDVMNVFNEMFKHEEFLKCIASGRKDFLNADTPPTDDLMFNQILPYRNITDAVEENKTIINFIFRGFHNESDSKIRNGYLEFHIYIHKDNILTDYGLRQYIIPHYLDSIYNKQKFSGVGKLYLSDFDEFPSPFRTDYTYHLLRYRVSYFE